MFAIPGILGLLFFIYLRPQEAVERLQDIPFLYIFFALACYGVAVDLRLRISKAMAVPHLPWALAFYLWSIVSVAINAPEGLLRTMILFGVTVIIFVLLAEGVQSFRVLEIVTLFLALIALCLALIGIDQGMSDFGCVKVPDGEVSHGKVLGEPDGRPCERTFNCYQGDPEPGADYWCEKIGVLGTHSVAGRVRYRGVLQDPNELALAIGAGLAFAIALAIRRRQRAWTWFAVGSLAAAAVCVSYTQSRSGQLVLLSVLGVYVLWRYRWKAVMIGAPVAIPLLLVIAAGGGRGDADASTLERYEAWRAGLDMLRQSPIWGVGQGQFAENHYLTAHNSFVLVLGELGMVGCFLFSMLIYTALKTPLVAVRRYRGRPEARAAEIWGVGLLAAFAAIFAGATFLSFSYHYILWIHLGLSAAYYTAVKLHDPDFQVRIGFLDMAAVAIVDVGLVLFFDLFLRLKYF